MKLQFEKPQRALSRTGKAFTESKHTLPQFVKPQTCFELLRIWCVCIILLFSSCNSSLCEIKNGYEKDILILKESLRNLTNILTEKKDLSAVQRRKIESNVETLINHISFYDLTENLLSQFKIIAPKLYAEIDTIRDCKGRPVDVYVKFVPADATRVKALGTTYINQLQNDKEAYLSEYGPFTVSVKIWIVSNALIVLSHELGHVKYQVPNLASYIAFHRAHYNDEQSNYIGHYADDPSGKTAKQSEKSFRKSFDNYLKANNGKMQNPIILLSKIRKSMSPKHYAVVNTSRPTVTM